MYKINSESVCSSKVDNETLLLNLDTGFYYTLDEVGGLIWELLLKGCEKNEVLGAVTSVYEVNAQQADQDFLQLIDMFQKEGLIQI